MFRELLNATMSDIVCCHQQRQTSVGNYRDSGADKFVIGDKDIVGSAIKLDVLWHWCCWRATLHRRPL